MYIPSGVGSLLPVLIFTFSLHGGIQNANAFHPAAAVISTSLRTPHHLSSASITTQRAASTSLHFKGRDYLPSRGLRVSIQASINPSTRTSTSTSTATSTSLNGMLNTAVLTASLSATSKLLSSIGIGALFTPAGPKKFGNVLDGSAVSALSKLTYWLFQPCFLLCGVASTLGKACSGTGGLPVDALMLLPMAALVQISLGALVSKLITTKRFGVRPLFLGIDTDDDAGASDIRMCTTFANSGPLPLILADALFGGALLTDVAACVSFYLLIWSPLFWTFGKIILGLSEKNDESGSGSGSGSAATTSVGVASKAMKQVKTLLSPPVIGSITGIMIGSSPILRGLFLNAGAPLAPVFGALRTFGVAYLPAAILVLAGSLVKKDASTSTSASPESPSDSVHPKTIIALLFSRFILSPMLALATVRLLSFANLLPVDNARTLAIVTFTLLMEGCMPPAQNSVIMLQLAEKKGRAAKMAKLLTVIYALSAIPVTLLLSGCLGMSGILNYA